MPISKLDSLQIGQIVDYGMYKNVIYRGTAPDGEVLLEDKFGNTKKIYRSLAEKYIKVVRG